MKEVYEGLINEYDATPRYFAHFRTEDHKNNHDHKEIIVTLNASLPQIGGVYFLLFNGVVVYVGETSNLKQRMSSHCRGKLFNEVRILPTKEDKNFMRRVEAWYISLFTPYYNNEDSHNNASFLSVDYSRQKKATDAFICDVHQKIL